MSSRPHELVACPLIPRLGCERAATAFASRATGLEAVITQTHNVFYVFTPSVDPPSQRGISGTVPLTATGRPILFAESGGHGVYSFGSGRWNPEGGRFYAEGPALSSHR